MVVCDPRNNVRPGNKQDQIDARELADRLYMNKLSSVYHGGLGVRRLRELAFSYLLQCVRVCRLQREAFLAQSAPKALPEMKQAILDGIAEWRHGPLPDDMSPCPLRASLSLVERTPS
jgi:hypothetical protein